MSFPLIRTAFAAGEISPALFGHVDIEKFGIAASTMRNMFVSFRGGSYSRAGTAYVLRSNTLPSENFGPPRVITFQFNINQGYCLELGDRYMRFFTRGAAVLEAPFNISAITLADPAVVTAPGNNFLVGDWIQVAGVNGTTQLNGRYFLVSVVSGADVTLQSLFSGAGIDSTTYTPYLSGGTLARVYTVGTPYAGLDVPAIKFAQSADTMSLTHPNYPPYDLKRLGPANWVLAPIQVGATLLPPASVTASATVQPSTATSPPTLPCAYAYVVTAVDSSGNESIASPVANITNAVDMAVTAGSNVIDWSPVLGAQTYNVYRAPTSYNTNPGSTTDALPVPSGAIFSFVGFTYGNQFIDANIIPDTTQVPPIHQNPFLPGQVLQIVPDAIGTGYTTATVTIASTAGMGFAGQAILVNGSFFGAVIQDPGGFYQAGDPVTITGDGTGATAHLVVGPESGTNPSVVSYLQQRRVYANTPNQPDTYFMSVPGQYLNFDSGIPVEANDAITGTPWAQAVDGIQWMVQVSGVSVMMTGDGLWQVTGAGGSPLNPQPLTPSSQQAIPQNFSGISALLPPIKIKNEILYVDAKGYVVWSAVYSYFTNNFPTTDLTVLSGHLFLAYDIAQWAWAEQPYKIIWAIRCDGVLLSLTYLKEQEVAGWARHDTQGQFISVTSVNETPVDAIYFVTLRDQSYGAFYFIERMDNRIWATAEDPWCVDAGLAYPQGAPGVSITADSRSGVVDFTASAPAFPATSVGSVLRIAGGIANITSMTDTQHLIGKWVLPPSNYAPPNI